MRVLSVGELVADGRVGDTGSHREHLLQELAPVVGLVAACALFIRSMSAQFRVEPVASEGRQRRFRLYGSLFFGAVTQIDQAVQAVEAGPDAPEVTLDALQLVYLDATGVDALRQLHQVVLSRAGCLTIENLQDQPREALERTGFAAVRIAVDMAEEGLITQAEAVRRIAETLLDEVREGRASLNDESVAALLGVESVEFPSNHAGFLAPQPHQPADPEGWATKLLASSLTRSSIADSSPARARCGACTRSSSTVRCFRPSHASTRGRRGSAWRRRSSGFRPSATSIRRTRCATCRRCGRCSRAIRSRSTRSSASRR